MKSILDVLIPVLLFGGAIAVILLKYLRSGRPKSCSGCAGCCERVSCPEKSEKDDSFED